MKFGRRKSSSHEQAVQPVEELTEAERLIDTALLRFAKEVIIDKKREVSDDEKKEFGIILEDRYKAIVATKTSWDKRLNQDKVIALQHDVKKTSFMVGILTVQGDWEDRYFRYRAKPATLDEYHNWLGYYLDEKRADEFHGKVADSPNVVRLYSTINDLEMVPDLRSDMMDSIYKRDGRPERAIKPTAVVIEQPGAFITDYEESNIQILSWNRPNEIAAENLFEFPNTREVLMSQSRLRTPLGWSQKTLGQAAIGELKPFGKN